METKNPADNLKRGEPRLVKLVDIDIDPDIQSRATGLNSEVVAEYAERFKSLAGLDVPDDCNENSVSAAIELYDATGMPRMEVVTVDYQMYLLASGFHRFEALEKIGCQVAPVEIYEGWKTEAQYLSMIANRSHGLRRTNADKRKATVAALEHPWTYNLSSVQIGEIVGVSHTFVDSVRKELEDEVASFADEFSPKKKKTQPSQTTHLSVSNECQLANGQNRQNERQDKKRQGKDGKLYPAKKLGRPAKSPPAAVEEEEWPRKRKSRLDKWFKDPEEETAKKTRKQTIAEAKEFITVDLPYDHEHAVAVLKETFGKLWFMQLTIFINTGKTM